MSPSFSLWREYTGDHQLVRIRIQAYPLPMRSFTATFAATRGHFIPATFLSLEVGGVTYRTDCAARGGTATAWSFPWFLPIPYLLAPSTPGCDTHSLTRVLGSAAGVWTIHSPSGVTQEPAAPASLTTPPMQATSTGLPGDAEKTYATRIAHIFSKLRTQNAASEKTKGRSRAQHQALLRALERRYDSVYISVHAIKPLAAYAADQHAIETDVRRIARLIHQPAHALSKRVDILVKSVAPAANAANADITAHLNHMSAIYGRTA